MNELTMKRCDENTETGVIDVVNENTEKGRESEPEKEQEAAPTTKSKATKTKRLKNEGKKKLK